MSNPQIQFGARDVSMANAQFAGSPWFDVTHPNYGAKGDGKTVTDGAITTGTATLTSASAAFTAADVGKAVVVNGAGASGVALITTISAYTSATTVTLAANAGTTVTGATVTYGTNDAAAIQAAINAAGAGGIVELPGQRVYAIGSTLTYPAGITIASSGSADSGFGTLKWIGTAAGTMLTPTNTSQDNYGVIIKDLEFDGNSLANIGLDLYHVLTSRIDNCHFHDCSNGANACGIRFYRNRDSGFNMYYNTVFGGSAKNCTIGLFVTGTGTGSQTSCCNDNWVIGMMFNGCGRSVYQERGSTLRLTISSENPTGAAHVEAAGVALTLSNSYIENFSSPNTTPGLLLDTTSGDCMEFGNFWAGFAGDAVQDNGDGTNGSPCIRFSQQARGSAGNWGAKAKYLQIVGSIQGSGATGAVLDLNASTDLTTPGTGIVRINRNCHPNGDSLQIYDNGTLLARVDAAGRMRAAGLADLAQTLTDAATVATDCTKGGYCKLTATAGIGATRTIGSPTNVVQQYLSYDILNSTGGAITTTWNAIFKLAGGAWTDPANGKRRTIRFYWDGTNWVEQYRASADI